MKRWWLKLAGLAFVASHALGAAAAPRVDAGASVITAVSPMAVARAAHQATLLQSGEVLITGGCSGSCDVPLSSTERFSPQAGGFRAAAPMAVARDSHAAIALADGRVLVAGGWSHRQATRSAELYAPDADRFTATGEMQVARAAPAAVRLLDGRVLLCGGQTSQLEPLATAELFDPAAGRFSSTAAMGVARTGHVAVTLSDGRVLVVGGRRARRGEILDSAEIFDPASGTFQATGRMASPRHKHAAALLPDGRVLVLGGADVRDQRGRYRSSELFDPASGTFSAGPDMHAPRFKLVDAVARLPSGGLLVAGGARWLERYEPADHRFVRLPDELAEAMEFATATLLPAGDVLLTGGYDDSIATSSSAWRVSAEP